MKKLLFAIGITLLFTACGGKPETNANTGTYTITYHGNGNTYGFPPVDNNQYTSGSYAVVLDKNTLQKTGYEFGGWNTKADYSGILYESGSKIEVKNINIFLYAVWNE